MRARAVNPRFKTGPLYSALQARGHKQASGGAIPRVYAGKRGASSRVVWPKSAHGLRSGGGRAKTASARRPFDSAPHSPAPVDASDPATGGGSASGDVGQSLALWSLCIIRNQLCIIHNHSLCIIHNHSLCICVVYKCCVQLCIIHCGSGVPKMYTTGCV